MCPSKGLTAILVAKGFTLNIESTVIDGIKDWTRWEYIWLLIKTNKVVINTSFFIKIDLVFAQFLKIPIKDFNVTQNFKNYGLIILS